LETARAFLNEYITPDEFLGMSLYEDEHPLMEREAETGKRNVVIYHTAGNKLQPIKELKADLVGDIYSFTKIVNPENKSWDASYNEAKEKLNSSG
jgi:hypothetical protein